MSLDADVSVLLREDCFVDCNGDLPSPGDFVFEGAVNSSGKINYDLLISRAKKYYDCHNRVEAVRILRYLCKIGQESRLREEDPQLYGHLKIASF